jgi:hypothetical protein
MLERRSRLLRISLIFVIAAALATTALAAVLRHRTRSRARVTPLAPSHAPRVNLPGPAGPPEQTWLLKGGLISGGFLGTEAKAQWPPWMQALIGNAPAVEAASLQDADLYKVPDIFLPRAIEILRTRGVFTPRLIRQATAIGYTAQAAEWDEAKTAYQLAWVRAQGLPLEDPLTTSRLLNQLARRGECDLVRELLRRSKHPVQDPKLHEAFLRMVDLEQGRLRATPALVLDESRPAVERLLAFTCLRRPAQASKLVMSFKGTQVLDQAAFHALSEKWIEASDPGIELALAMQKTPKPQEPWMLVRPVERVSDLLWLRAMDALEAGDASTAAARARRILEGYPESWFAGHAAYLMKVLEPGFQVPARSSLRAPADLTWYNAEGFREAMPTSDQEWPEAHRVDAQRGRFDLILAKADPERETSLFLRAAHSAGQQDLVARYLACEGGCSAERALYLYPLGLAPLVDRLIREEGLEGQVDAAFVLAMIKNESVFQPTARSGANAFGIMQLLRSTFRYTADRGADILDPVANIRAGLRYYRTVINTAKLRELPMETRLCYVLAGYHAGEGRAKRWREEREAALGGRTTPMAMLHRMDTVPITSTRLYVTHAMGDREIFRSLLEGQGR